MPRAPTGHIHEHRGADGTVSWSVRFKGDGFPREQIYLGNSAEGMTRTRAEDEARVIRAQIRAGTYQPQRRPARRTEPSVPTFTLLANEHYERKRIEGAAANTIRDTRDKLELHLLPFFGELPVDEFSEELIESYVAHKQAENERIHAAEADGAPLRRANGQLIRTVSPGTINSQLRLLALILDRAVRQGWLARNPARGHGTRLRVRRTRKYGLELDEALSLIDAAGSRDRLAGGRNDELRRHIVTLRDEEGLPWKLIAERVGKSDTACIYHYQRQPRPTVPVRRAIISTLALAGLRIGELCALNCAHIDLAHHIIRVVDAKTPKGVREVDIHPDLLEELVAYKMALRDRWQPDLPAFPTSRGTRRDRHRIARWVIAPAVAEANAARETDGMPPIGQHVTPHTLRYTYIALTLFAGASVRYVADQVGHEDVLTTQRIYAYVLKRLERGEVGRKRQLLVERARDATSARDVTMRDRTSAQAEGLGAPEKAHKGTRSA